MILQTGLFKGQGQRSKIRGRFTDLGLYGLLRHLLFKISRTCQGHCILKGGSRNKVTNPDGISYV